MVITAVCPGCGRRYRLKEEMAGRRGRCACGKSINLPSNADPTRQSGTNAEASELACVEAELIEEPFDARETGKVRMEGSADVPIAGPPKQSEWRESQSPVTNVRPLGLFWLKVTVTLASSLTAEQVRKRLADVLPRFAVPTGEPIPRFGVSLSSYYLGSMKEWAFRMTGPHGIWSRMKGVGTLDVAGSIEESPDGSLIHISARPIMALLGCSLWCAVGVSVGGLFAILDRVVVLPLVMMAVCAIPGVLVYVIGVLRARTDFCRLTGCLQTMLTARRVR